MRLRKGATREDVDGDKLSGCSFCSCDDPGGYHRVEDHLGEIARSPWHLCRVCYCTMGGTVHHYNQQYDGTAAAAIKMMAQTTNMLLRRIEKLERRLAE